MQDILLTNGLIMDGTGSKAYAGGVAIKNGLIARVGDVSGMEARETVDCRGAAIAPGFIDAHGHSDLCFINDDRCEGKLTQGVTTEVSGMCGTTYFPALPGRVENNTTMKNGFTEEEWAAESFLAFRKHAEKEHKRMTTNLVQFSGHGAIRAGVMGYEDREPSNAELGSMCDLLDRDLSDGAWGLSLGLEYTPGCFAKRRELLALGEVVKSHDALLTAHMRSEGEFLEEAIEEVLDIGRTTGARLEISHLKIDRMAKWGQAPRIWKMICDAKAEGIDVGADMYPYFASSTGITNRCPKWSIAGGKQMAAAHLQGSRRQEVLDYLASRFPDKARAEGCLFTTTYGTFPEAEGKNLYEVAEMLGTDYAHAAAEVIVRSAGSARCCFFVMDPKDVDYFLRQDICICSDGSGYPVDAGLMKGERPHPRNFGAITRFLRLAREEKFCTAEEAVQRITAKPAQMLHLNDRGMLKEGLAADVTVFDPARVGDKADWTDPFQRSEGILHIVINGEIAMTDGVQTDARPGSFLLHQ